MTEPPPEMDPGRIYHLTTAPELRAGCSRSSYVPARLAADGFVHCAGTPAVTVAVANDYYAEAAEPLLVLAIDASKLSAALRFEDPAPIEGGGRAHLEQADRFPHVYGPVDRAAIVAVGRMRRTAAGWAWPARLEDLESILAGT